MSYPRRISGVALFGLLAGALSLLAQPEGEWAWASGGRLPSNAFVGGSEGEVLYICRGEYRGGVHPGKVVGDSCNIGYGGQEIQLSSFEVLAYGRPVRWVPGPRVPDDAIPGGREGDNPLYVCRASYRGGTHPGKVVDGRCNIGWGGDEVVLDQYEVLLERWDLRWVTGPSIPRSALAGGWEDGGPIYVCRGSHAGGVHPGKVVSGYCNIGYGGEEVLLTSYEILTTGGR